MGNQRSKKGLLPMKQTSVRLGVVACTVFLSQFFGVTSALAVPSDKLAWSDLDRNIFVYKDADPSSEIYWFVPKLRFESSGGKTVLRASTLANGKVEYITRIIPYFNRPLREYVAENLPNVRQDSQLRPVVAKDISISIPDFQYKYLVTPSVTNYQYLDVARLVRFQLDADAAKTFDMLYKDDLGVPVDFTISYDGVVTDKFLNVNVDCKQVKSNLDAGTARGSTAGGKINDVYLGADLEAAVNQASAADTANLTITSKGDITGLQDMVRRVMNTCFDPVDNSGFPINNRDSSCGYFGCSNSSNNNGANGSDPNPDGSETTLPTGMLRVKFKYKPSSSNVDNKSVVDQVQLKDAPSTQTLSGRLSAKADDVTRLEVTPVLAKKITVTSGSASAATPFTSGIRVVPGQEYTIQADIVLKAKTPATGVLKTYSWDSTWKTPDGDLYFRVGNGKWEPVNRRAIITSDVVGGGGALQFYIDRSAIFNKIPANLRKGNIFMPAAFSVAGFAPEFSIEISGQKLLIQ